MFTTPDAHSTYIIGEQKLKTNKDVRRKKYTTTPTQHKKVRLCMVDVETYTEFSNVLSTSARHNSQFFIGYEKKKKKMKKKGKKKGGGGGGELWAGNICHESEVIKRVSSRCLQALSLIRTNRPQQILTQLARKLQCCGEGKKKEKKERKRRRKKKGWGGGGGGGLCCERY